MEIFDNSPVYEPCIGRLVREHCCVGHLLDNCIYLITPQGSPLAARAEAVRADFERIIGNQADEFFNTYSLETVEQVELANHPEIRGRIDHDGDNLVLQLPNYTGSAARFIVARTTEERLLGDLALMVRAAERIARHEITLRLEDYALDNLDEFAGLLRNAFADPYLRDSLLAHYADEKQSPSFGMLRSAPDYTEKMQEVAPCTYRKQQEIFDRLYKNLKKCHKKDSAQARAEIEYIIGITDPATLLKSILAQSPQVREKIMQRINPSYLASTSTLKVEVRNEQREGKKKPNDGHYNLFFANSNGELMVYFQRKGSYILYLVYLLDRKVRGDRVDTLDLARHEALFVRLYDLVYGAGGKDKFDTMMEVNNTPGEMMQKNVYSLYYQARLDIGLFCEKLREAPEPFLIHDINSHLAVLPENITLPPEILSLAKC